MNGSDLEKNRDMERKKENTQPKGGMGVWSMDKEGLDLLRQHQEELEENVPHFLLASKNLSQQNLEGEEQRF